MSPQFFGKYRGTVESNQDPNNLGRLQVSVPSILGQATNAWAMPCVPYAGDQVGLYLIPPVGANVWVEFEGGDPDYPIWSGCFWGDNQVPAQPAQASTKVLKTDSATITLNDAPGSSSVTIETGSGLKIVMDSNGIELTNGQGASLKLSGPSIKLNNDALEVM